MFHTHSLTGDQVINKFKERRYQFGIIRIETGALLCLIKKHNLWKGRAGSFSEFLAGYNLKIGTANQYIKVAEKFYYELAIRDSRLDILAKCSMTTLAKIASKVNAGNIDKVMLMLENLSDDDVRIEIGNLEEDARPIKNIEVSESYLKARKLIDGMSLEEKVALRNELYSGTR